MKKKNQNSETLSVSEMRGFIKINKHVTDKELKQAVIDGILEKFQRKEKRLST